MLSLGKPTRQGHKTRPGAVLGLWSGWHLAVVPSLYAGPYSPPPGTPTTDELLETTLAMSVAAFSAQGVQKDRY